MEQKNWSNIAFGLPPLLLGVAGVLQALRGDITDHPMLEHPINHAFEYGTGLVSVGLIVISLLGMTRGWNSPIGEEPRHS